MARADGKAEIQHYVPKLLLRGFLSAPQEKEQVFVYDKHEDRLFLTNIANITAERGFYEIDDPNEHGTIESIFSELESNTKPAYEKLVDSEDLAALDDIQKTWLSFFVAFQHLRTRHIREIIQLLNDKVREHIEKLGFDPHETEGFEPVQTKEDLTRASLIQLAQSVGMHSQLISKKACFLVTTSADRPFWISDHPVAMHNNRDLSPYGNIGLAVPGIEVYLPLTSTLLLAFWCPTNADKLAENVAQAKIARDELAALRVLNHNVSRDEVRSQLDKLQAIIDEGEPLLVALRKGSSIAATAENVTFYNHLQVRWAHRYLINSNDDFGLVKEMISDNPKYRTGLKPTFG